MIRMIDLELLELSRKLQCAWGKESRVRRTAVSSRCEGKRRAECLTLRFVHEILVEQLRPRLRFWLWWIRKVG